MKNKKVSVVIPVRNAERYVERCVKSVQQQTYADLDIIIVLNDSSDKSESICKKLKHRDSRIRLVATKQAGVSKARNLGIEMALGDYITFIDVDDFIHTSLIQNLYMNLNNYSADIVTANFEKHNVNMLGGTRENSFHKTTISAENYAQRMLIGKREYDGYIWGKLYRTSLLSDTKFDETLMFSEDTDFLLRLLRQDLRVYISSFIGYFYSQDTSGITKDTSGDQRLKSLELSQRFVSEAINHNIQHASRCYCWRNSYYVLSQSSISPDNQNKTWTIMKKYRMAVVQDASSPLRYRIIAISSLFGKYVFLNIILRLIHSK